MRRGATSSRLSRVSRPPTRLVTTARGCPPRREVPLSARTTGRWRRAGARAERRARACRAVSRSRSPQGSEATAAQRNHASNGQVRSSHDSPSRRIRGSIRSRGRAPGRSVDAHGQRIDSTHGAFRRTDGATVPRPGRQSRVRQRALYSFAGGVPVSPRRRNIRVSPPPSVAGGLTFAMPAVGTQLYPRSVPVIRFLQLQTIWLVEWLHRRARAPSGTLPEESRASGKSFASETSTRPGSRWPGSERLPSARRCATAGFCGPPRAPTNSRTRDSKRNALPPKLPSACRGTSSATSPGTDAHANCLDASH